MPRLPLTVTPFLYRSFLYGVCIEWFTSLLFFRMLTGSCSYSFCFFHPVDISTQLKFTVRYMEFRLQNIPCHCFRFHLQGCIAEIM